MKKKTEIVVILYLVANLVHYLVGYYLMKRTLNSKTCQCCIFGEIELKEEVMNRIFTDFISKG